MKINKKLEKKITGILLLIFFSVASYFFSWDYFAFQVEEREKVESQEQLKSGIESFSYENIQEIESIDFFATPNLIVRDYIKEKIDNAKEKVFLNTYIFTEKEIRKSIIDAHKRGVKVEVILEKNVYLAPHLNNPSFEELENAWIAVHWSNPYNYALNHAKYFVIDNELIVSTGNVSYANFATNRDLFLFIWDSDFVSFAEEVFRRDFAWEEKELYHDSFLLSPTSSRKKISYLLDIAQQDIKMYVPYLQDKAIFEIIKKKREEGVNITIITNEPEEDIFFEKLQKLWVEIVFIKRKVHAKAILIDNKFLYVGSINFSSASMDENMEMGIVLKNKEIIEDFWEVFNWDYQN